MMVAERKAIEINNDSLVLKDVSKDLMEKLRAMNVAENVIFDIQVSFEEALRNAMVHGNKSRGDKKVKVETEIESSYVVISIEDQGDGFDVSKLPDPTHSENLLRESGRGVYLMRHLMDELGYDKGGRRVIMKKNFKKEG
jgi:serine/threonine-protein kinase RsbW